MPGDRDLHGQQEVLRHVRELLAAGRSVLLLGPEAIGKSTLIAAMADNAHTVIDPFDHISRQRACEFRRALDRGSVILAAARTLERHQLGAVGRILWRFTIVRVRPLSPHALRRILLDELGSFGHDAEAGWIRDIVALAQGRPGFASAMGRFAQIWRNQHGYLPMPEFAFATVREGAVLRALQDTHQAAGRERRDGLHSRVPGF